VVPLTLQKLARASGVSSSYLGRIESGKRFPSAHVLRKIAKPLGFEEEELFDLAGYLSHYRHSVAESHPSYNSERLDPYVAAALSQEPLEAQRAVLDILSLLKIMTKNTAQLM
jgi:transcriptional regulator with XRE-family HTH domain